jgi:hypothetical protein
MREEVREGSRELRNGEFHHLYSFPSIIRMIKTRRMKFMEHVACMIEKRNACRFLIGKPEEQRPLEKGKLKWESTITMNLREI